ncbi:MAG: serine/threonine protein kinase [Labilithrix sp.]|nr:serine/threonine protein kinase [Labilithrix sp.]
MRVRLDKYEIAHRSAQTRSLLAFVFGGIGIVVFGFLTFLGAIMFVLPTGDGGGLYAQRSGIVVGLFMGAMPTVISTLVVVWGAKKRARFRRLGALAGLARQTPLLTTSHVAQSLRLSPIDADGLVLEATALGLIDDGPHATPVTAGALAPTVASDGAGPSNPPPAGERVGPGTVLGGAYRIEEPLGRGGMGEVHAARHLRTGRRYAVKTILPGARVNDALVRRFEREATAASAIGHPGIVQVHDFNVAPGGLFYLVMDLLEGETLATRLERTSALSWPEARRIATELCAALGAAHDHGLLHRDIKPGNIFLAKSAARPSPPERAVLVDFGLVKPMEETSAVTSTGAVVGTPMYMSPEQARGETLDVRSDLYSLAAVIFEMITGAPPFIDRTMASVYARLLKDPPPRASQVSSRAIPPAVDDVLVKALAKDRAARFGHARLFGEALASIAPDAAGAGPRPEEGAAPTTERMVN